MSLGISLWDVSGDYVSDRFGKLALRDRERRSRKNGFGSQSSALAWVQDVSHLQFFSLSYPLFSELVLALGSPQRAILSGLSTLSLTW